jgi:hypothetical protein
VSLHNEDNFCYKKEGELFSDCAFTWYCLLHISSHLTFSSLSWNSCKLLWIFQLPCSLLKWLEFPYICMQLKLHTPVTSESSFLIHTRNPSDHYRILCYFEKEWTFTKLMCLYSVFKFYHITFLLLNLFFSGYGRIVRLFHKNHTG